MSNKLYYYKYIKIIIIILWFSRCCSVQLFHQKEQLSPLHVNNSILLKFLAVSCELLPICIVLMDSFNLIPFFLLTLVHCNSQSELLDLQIWLKILYICNYKKLRDLQNTTWQTYFTLWNLLHILFSIKQTILMM